MLRISHYIVYQQRYTERHINVSTILRQKFHFQTLYLLINRLVILFHFKIQILLILILLSILLTIGSPLFALFKQPPLPYQSPVRNFYCGLVLILTFVLNLLNLIINVFLQYVYILQKWFQNMTYTNSLYRGEVSTLRFYCSKYSYSYMNFFFKCLKLEAVSCRRNMQIFRLL